MKHNENNHRLTDEGTESISPKEASYKWSLQNLLTLLFIKGFLEPLIVKFRNFEAPIHLTFQMIFLKPAHQKWGKNSMKQ